MYTTKSAPQLTAHSMPAPTWATPAAAKPPPEIAFYAKRANKASMVATSFYATVHDDTYDNTQSCTYYSNFVAPTIYTKPPEIRGPVEPHRDDASRVRQALLEGLE